MTSHPRLAACLFVLAAAAPATALAQASIDAQLFTPAVHGESFFTTETGAIAPSLELRAAAWFIYTHKPLNLLTVQGATTTEAAVVRHRFDLHLTGAISLVDRLSLGVAIPTTLYQSATIPDPAGVAQSLAAVAFGDLKISAKVGILKVAQQYLDLGLIAFITFPTGAKGAFVGDSTVTGGFDLLVSRPVGPLTFALNFGAILRGEQTINDLTVGHQLTYKVGAAFDAAYFSKLVPLEVVGEIFGRTNATRPWRYGQENPLEWLLGLRMSFLSKRIMLSASFGRGLLAGYGAPDARAVLGLTVVPLRPSGEAPASKPVDADNDGLLDPDDKCALQPEDKDGFKDDDGCPDPDNDGDGIIDQNDKCPLEPEDQDGTKDDDGCIDPDNDGDGIVDAADKCPLQAEDLDGFQDEDGCAEADNDDDGIIDAEDKCPTQAEDKDGFQDEDGCPDPDNDNDGITDANDKCPNEEETINLVDDFDGCPDKGQTLVVVSREQISILEKVYFDKGKDTVKAVSFGLLKQVAAVLKTRAGIKKVRVEGHSDDIGPDAFNLTLSQKRADAVRAFLINEGIAGERLDAVGYGESRPMVPNTSERNRNQNRRVTFVILETDSPAGSIAVPASAPSSLP